jgi:hypothetical protein
MEVLGPRQTRYTHPSELALCGDSFVLLPGKMLRRMFCLMNFTTDTWEFLEGLTVSCMTRNRDSRLYFQPGFEL